MKWVVRPARNKACSALRGVGSNRLVHDNLIDHLAGLVAVAKARLGDGAANGLGFRTRFEAAELVGPLARAIFHPGSHLCFIVDKVIERQRGRRGLEIGGQRQRRIG